MLYLSHAAADVLVHYNLLVPINEGMYGNSPQGATQAPPPGVNGKQLRAKTKSFPPMAGRGDNAGMLRMLSSS